MVNAGLLVNLDAKWNKHEETESFLVSAVPLVAQEAGTIAWFALRFGRGEYGIFDAFPSDAERDAHLNGSVASALQQNAGTLFDEPPSIRKLEILASKLPPPGSNPIITKALLLTFRAKSGHEQDVVQFLLDAKGLVEQEPQTIAWFAIRLDDDGMYGIFDVFPDDGGRFAHLTGQVPRELAKHAFTLLGSVPETHLPNVLASHFAG